MNDTPGHQPELPAAPIRKRARLFGILALLLAAVIFGFGVLPPLLFSRVDWRPVPCSVLESEVVVETREEPWGNNMREFEVYVPQITYTYEFAGSQHESTRISRSASDSSRDPAHAQALVEQFPAGSERTCHVNPDSPSEAVLLPGESRTVWAFALGGLILAVFGLGGVLLGARS